jgi:periplasmic protein TonB
MLQLNHKKRLTRKFAYRYLMLNLRLEEITVVVCFSVLHLGFYYHVAQLSQKTVKTTPILIEFIHPLPPPKVELPKVEQPPKPKLIDAPPKPKQPPKPLQSPKPAKAKIVKPKTVIEKTEVKKVVFKPRLQQESLIKVHAEEVVEKEVVEHAQSLSEPEVKKPDNKPEAKEAEAPEKAESVHEPVMTKVTGIGSCSSTLNNYPAEAREQGLEGVVKVKVQVLADGSVGSASIVKSSGHSILDESVLANVHDCNFEAAEKDGVPVSSKVVIPVRFKLD